LGRAQVFDLTQHRPDRVLARIWQNLQEAEAKGDARAAATRRRLRVVACGGDGTIAWILKVVASLGLQPEPAVAVVPLGTGNDLSRTFGWGAAYSHAWFTGFRATYKALRRFAEAPATGLDRWRVRLFVPDRQFLPSRTYAVADPGDGGELALAEGARDAASAIGQVLLAAQRQQQERESMAQSAGGGGGGGRSGGGNGPILSSSGAFPLSPLSGARVQPPAGWRPAAQDGLFWNYFSIGADALAAFRFHHMREGNPACAGSRLANQFWYSWFSCSSGWFAPHVACSRDVPPVARLVVVEVLDSDGMTWRHLPVPSSIRALVVVNLQSYGGGRNIWGAGVPNPASAGGGGAGAQAGNGTSGGGGGGLSSSATPWQPTVNRPPSVSDGLFELVGFASGYHAMAVMASHAKVAHGVRLAQASGIRVALKAASARADGEPGRVYLQMDGEPWEQPVPSGVGEPPVVVEIVHDGVSRVLSNRARGGDMDRPGPTGAGAAGGGVVAGGAGGVSAGGVSLAGGGGAPAAATAVPQDLQAQYLEEMEAAKAPMSPMTTVDGSARPFGGVGGTSSKRSSGTGGGGGV
jgi:diacylglycerol kinase (ATP)